jgi:NTE family protein
MSEAKDSAGLSQRVGLALSGGGSRAIAFHLGCLRALHDAGVLEEVTTLSSVSGGSVLAALYCTTPGDFAAFEARARALLRKGLVRPTMRVALTTSEGFKAFICTNLLGLDRFAAFLVRSARRLLGNRSSSPTGWLRKSRLKRTFSRTTILREALDQIFVRATLADLRADRPRLIIVACELQTKSAFYFTRGGLASWRFGEASAEGIKLSHAVVASAAYPLLLPALDGELSFRKAGDELVRQVILTDGGVYDNSGLSPLWPDRNPGISFYVAEHERLIACRAGYGLGHDPAPTFLGSRMTAAFNAVHARAQNAAVQRLFELERNGKVKAILLPFLDQPDEQLLCAPDDLVPRVHVSAYPTDFYAMSDTWAERLIRRGEQVTKALLEQHWSIT